VAAEVLGVRIILIPRPLASTRRLGGLASPSPSWRLGVFARRLGVSHEDL